MRPCSIWGPTCDGLDVIVENLEFPVLDVGDWIMFENMGAYTFSSASTFNGFPIPKIYAVINESTMWEMFYWTFFVVVSSNGAKYFKLK